MRSNKPAESKCADPSGRLATKIIQFEKTKNLKGPVPKIEHLCQKQWSVMEGPRANTLPLDTHVRDALRTPVFELEIFGIFLKNAKKIGAIILNYASPFKNGFLKN